MVSIKNHCLFCFVMTKCTSFCKPLLHTDQAWDPNKTLTNKRALLFRQKKIPLGQSHHDFSSGIKTVAMKCMTGMSKDVCVGVSANDQ